jgi:hypothetical protein
MRTMLRAGLPTLLIALLASGCLLPPDPATEAGQDVFNLYLIVLALAAGPQFLPSSCSSSSCSA